MTTKNQHVATHSRKCVVFGWQLELRLEIMLNSNYICSCIMTIFPQSAMYACVDKGGNVSIQIANLNKMRLKLNNNVHIFLGLFIKYFV